MSTDERLNLVCKIMFKDCEDKKSEGSGFLIDKNIVITAYHNIKAYKTLGKELLIKFINKESSISCRIEAVIDYDEETDIAIIRIDQDLKFNKYFKLVEFPILNNIGATIEDIQINVIGFRSGVQNEDVFSGVINNLNADESIIINYNRDMNAESFGLSGSPIVIKETFYVYGINIKQHDPDSGLHLKSIITHSKRVKDFLSRNSIEIESYESHKLIGKNIYKEQLLDEVMKKIKQKEILNNGIKSRIERITEELISYLKDIDCVRFEKFINSIKLNGKQQIDFELNSNYKESILHISEIICHIAILELTYIDKKITFEMIRTIQIKDGKYLSYIYPFERSSYLVNAHKLFRHILNNQECNFDGVKQVLVGNTSTSGECSGCIENSNGVTVDFSKIINNICEADGYDMDIEKHRINITNVKSNLESIHFHCTNCLGYDDKENISEVKQNVKNILGD